MANRKRKPEPVFTILRATRLLVCLFATGSIVSSATDEQADVFEEVWASVNESYYDADFGGRDWGAIGDRYRSRLGDIDDSGDLQKLLSEMLNELGESHIAVISSEYSEIGRKSWGGGDAGLELTIADKVPVVFRTEATGPAEEAGLQPGMEIRSIGGVEASEIRDVVFESGIVPSLARTHWLTALESQLNGRPGELIEIEASHRNRTQSYEVALAPFNGVFSAAFGNLAALPIRTEAKLLDSGIAYLRFNLWLPATMTEIKAFIASLEPGTPGLIIDLRGNPGGMGIMAAGVCGLLVEEERVLGEMTLRKGNFNFIAYPQRGRFAGPVAVLVDGSSASTSEIFAAAIQDFDRGVVVGERTAGAALPSIFISLPNGDLLQLATANYVSSTGRRIEGVGVEPDLEAPLSRKSLRKGVDNVINKAVGWIEASN